MHILFVTSSAPQGQGDSTSPFILTMAEDLQALGHQVTILAPHAANVAQAEYLNHVRVVRFRYAFPARLETLTDGGSAMLKLKRSPLKALLLPCFAIGQALALRRLLKTEPVDILHSHWLLPQGLIAGLLARAFGLPHIAMAHGADVFGLQQRLWLWCKKQALARTTYVIANSSATATAIRALNADVPLDVIPVGATPPENAIIPLAERSGSSQPLILFVGRLFEGKGLAYGLEALAKLPNATLKVFGDGPDRAALQAQAARLGVAGRTEFAGNVAHSQLLAEMQHAQLLIAPSITIQDGWREGQGNAIIEAMLAGLPVIASDSGGIVDSVIHEQTGLLVPEKVADALAAAIRRLLEEPHLAQRLADSGRTHALTHFTRQGSAKRIAAVYERLR